MSSRNRPARQIRVSSYAQIDRDLHHLHLTPFPASLLSPPFVDSILRPVKALVYIIFAELARTCGHPLLPVLVNSGGVKGGKVPAFPMGYTLAHRDRLVDGEWWSNKLLYTEDFLVVWSVRNCTLLNNWKSTKQHSTVQLNQY